MEIVLAVVVIILLLLAGCALGWYIRGIEIETDRRRDANHGVLHGFDRLGE